MSDAFQEQLENVVHSTVSHWKEVIFFELEIGLMEILQAHQGWGWDESVFEQVSSESEKILESGLGSWTQWLEHEEKAGM